MSGALKVEIQPGSSYRGFAIMQTPHKGRDYTATEMGAKPYLECRAAFMLSEDGVERISRGLSGTLDIDSHVKSHSVSKFG